MIYSVNRLASTWWESTVYYLVKKPVIDLFVGSSLFNGKGFEMIKKIKDHFSPSGLVEAINKLLALCNLQQAPSEDIVSLKAHVSCLATALDTLGMPVCTSLQVGFMLRSLCSGFAPVVDQFLVGQRDLLKSSLETVVLACTAY